MKHKKKTFKRHADTTVTLSTHLESLRIHRVIPLVWTKSSNIWVMKQWTYFIEIERERSLVRKGNGRVIARTESRILFFYKKYTFLCGFLLEKYENGWKGIPGKTSKLFIVSGIYSNSVFIHVKLVNVTQIIHPFLYRLVSPISQHICFRCNTNQHWYFLCFWYYPKPSYTQHGSHTSSSKTSGLFTFKVHIYW